MEFEFFKKEKIGSRCEKSTQCVVSDMHQKIPPSWTSGASLTLEYLLHTYQVSDAVPGTAASAEIKRVQCLPHTALTGERR